METIRADPKQLEHGPYYSGQQGEDQVRGYSCSPERDGTEVEGETMLNLIYEMSLNEYHEKKFPAWIAGIPGEELLWEFSCNDQDCEGAVGAGLVRVFRKLRKAA